MLLSLAVIFIFGLLFAAIAEKAGLPRIIGMLVSGAIISPYMLGLLDDDILNISSQLRQTALIIILIKAGLSLDISDLKKVGRPAVLLAFLPASFEMLAYTVFAPMLLDITRTEAAVMGSVLSAVSPAVVVPRMVRLIEQKRGTKKGIPQMMLAGASCDDVFVIVMFSAFLAMVQGGKAKAADFLNIPVSIVSGVAIGAVTGMALYLLFEKSYSYGRKIRNTTKVIIILAAAFMLTSAEDILKKYVAVSGLLAVVAMACIIKRKSEENVSSRLSEKFGKLWIGAEVVLFVLVGAAVDIRYTLMAGGAALLMILIALAIRSIGVFICLLATNLSRKERLFCIITYLPKATVQAAIGSVPLSLGLGCGSIVLSVAVLAIVITAPLGAVGIDRTCNKLLDDDS